MGRSKKKSASKVAAVADPASSPAKALKNGKSEAEVVIENELVSASLESEQKPKAKARKKRKRHSESHSDISGVEAVAVAAPPPPPPPPSDGRSEEDVVVPASSPEKPSGVDEPSPKKQSTGGGGFKTLFIKNLSFQVKKEDVLEFFKPAGEVVDVRLAKREGDSFKGKAYVDFATAEQAEKALLELNGKKMMHRAVRLAKEEKESTDGKTLFAYNISYQAQKADVLEFFKPAEGVVDVRLIMREADSFKGYGHVDFATAEQAEKALLELQGKELLDRPVRLIIARAPKKGEYRPLDKRPDLEVFVTGFDSHEREDNIRATLMDHFACCGEIDLVSIPTGHYGKPVGLAYVRFLNENARNKALELGTDTMVVEVPRRKKDTPATGA